MTEPRCARRLRDTLAAAEPCWEDDAEQPELGHRRDGGKRQFVSGLPLVDVRRQPPSGNVAHDRPERLVLVVELDHVEPPFALNDR